MLKWQQIDTLHRRAPVKGGWIIRGVAMDGNAIALCFVPDTMHAWELELEASNVDTVARRPYVDG